MSVLSLSERMRPHFISNSNTPQSNSAQNTSSQPPFMENLSNKAAKLFRALYKKGVIDSEGKLTPSFAAQEFPHLPNTFITYLTNQFSKAFAQHQGVTMVKLMHSLNCSFGTARSAIEESYLHGDLATSLLLSAEFDYLRLIFKQFKIEDIYDELVGKEFQTKIPEKWLIRSPIQFTKWSDLELYFEHFVTSLSGKYEREKARKEFSLFVIENEFYEFHVPGSQFRWMLKGKLHRECLFSIHDVAIPLSFLFSPNTSVRPKSLMKTGLQGVFDVLLKVIRAPNPKEINPKGYSQLQLYYLQGFTNAETETEPTLFDTHCSRIKNDSSNENQADLARLLLTRSTETKAPELSAQWAIHFNATGSIQRKFQCTGALPSLNSSSVVLIKIHTLFKQLPYRTCMDFLDLYAHFADALGSACIHRNHQFFKSLIFEILIEENVRIRWEPDESSTERILGTKQETNEFEQIEKVALELEELLEYFLDSQKKSIKGFPFPEKLCASSLPCLQAMGLWAMDQTSNGNRELAFLKFYPSVAASLKNEKLKARLHAKAEAVLKSSVPEWKEHNSQTFRQTWAELLFKHLPASEELCLSFLSKNGGECDLKALFEKTSVLAHPGVAKALLKAIEKHQKPSPFQYIAACLEKNTNGTPESQDFFFYLTEQLKAYILKPNGENPEAVMKVVEMTCERLYKWGQTARSNQFFTIVGSQKSIFLPSSKHQVLWSVKWLKARDPLQDGNIWQDAFNQFENALPTLRSVSFDEKEKRDVLETFYLLYNRLLATKQAERAHRLMQSAKEVGLETESSFSSSMRSRLEVIFTQSLEKEPSLLSEAWKILELFLCKLKEAERVSKLAHYLLASLSNNEYAKQKEHFKALGHLLDLLATDPKLIKEENGKLGLLFLRVLEKYAPLNKHFPADAIEQIYQVLPDLLSSGQDSKVLFDIMYRISFLQVTFTATEAQAEVWFNHLLAMTKENEKNRRTCFLFGLTSSLAQFGSVYNCIMDICLIEAKNGASSLELIEKTMGLPLPSGQKKEQLLTYWINFLSEIKLEEKRIEQVEKIYKVDPSSSPRLVEPVLLTCKGLGLKKPEEALSLLSHPILAQLDSGQVITKHKIYYQITKCLLENVKKLRHDKKQQSEFYRLLDLTKKCVQGNVQGFSVEAAEDLWIDLLDLLGFAGRSKEQEEVWNLATAQKIFSSKQKTKEAWTKTLTSLGSNISLMHRLLSDKIFEDLFFDVSDFKSTLEIFDCLFQNRQWENPEEGSDAFHILFQRFDEFNEKYFEPSHALRFSVEKSENFVDLVINRLVCMTCSTFVSTDPNAMQQAVKDQKIGIIADKTSSDELHIYDFIHLTRLRLLFVRKVKRGAIISLKTYLSLPHTGISWQRIVPLINAMIDFMPTMMESKDPVELTHFLSSLNLLLMRYGLGSFIPGFDYFKNIPKLTKLLTSLHSLPLEKEEDKNFHEYHLSESLVLILETGCAKEKLAKQKGSFELIRSVIETQFARKDEVHLKSLSRLCQLQANHYLDLCGQNVLLRLDAYHLQIRIFNMMLTKETLSNNEQTVAFIALESMKQLLTPLHPNFQKMMEDSIQLLTALNGAVNTCDTRPITHLNDLWKELSLPCKAPTNKKNKKEIVSRITSEDQFKWKVYLIETLIEKIPPYAPTFAAVFIFLRNKIEELKRTYSADSIKMKKVEELFNKIKSPLSNNNNESEEKKD